ncbi:7221_t:CDS:1, partial [Cetraspora pellucida]
PIKLTINLMKLRSKYCIGIEILRKNTIEYKVRSEENVEEVGPKEEKC